MLVKLLVVIFAVFVISCATDTRTGAIENFLVPPEYKTYNPKRGGPFVRERSVEFINGLYGKWGDYRRKVTEQGILAFQRDVRCSNEIEREIRGFKWPVKWNDFKSERGRILDELRMLNC